MKKVDLNTVGLKEIKCAFEIVLNNRYLSVIMFILSIYVIYKLGEETGALYYKIFLK